MKSPVSAASCNWAPRPSVVVWLSVTCPGLRRLRAWRKCPFGNLHLLPSWILCYFGRLQSYAQLLRRPSWCLRPWCSKWVWVTIWDRCRHGQAVLTDSDPNCRPCHSLTELPSDLRHKWSAQIVLECQPSAADQWLFAWWSLCPIIQTEWLHACRGCDNPLLAISADYWLYYVLLIPARICGPDLLPRGLEDRLLRHHRFSWRMTIYN